MTTDLGRFYENMVAFAAIAGYAAILYICWKHWKSAKGK